MSNVKDEQAVNEAYRVTRHLKLVPVTTSGLEAALSDIQALEAVEKAFFNDKKRMLTVIYDASKQSIDNVAAVLARHEQTISPDWLTRCRQSYYRFTDENIHNNAKHEHVCCNKTPGKR